MLQSSQRDQRIRVKGGSSLEDGVGVLVMYCGSTEPVPAGYITLQLLLSSAIHTVTGRCALPVPTASSPAATSTHTQTFLPLSTHTHVPPFFSRFPAPNN